MNVAPKRPGKRLEPRFVSFTLCAPRILALLETLCFEEDHPTEIVDRKEWKKRYHGRPDHNVGTDTQDTACVKRDAVRAREATFWRQELAPLHATQFAEREVPSTARAHKLGMTPIELKHARATHDLRAATVFD